MPLTVLALAGCAGGVSSPANSITDSGATLNGAVFDPSDATVSYWFQYGRSTSYATETTHRTIAIADRANHAVSETIGGLDQGTTYHFRVCAQDSGSPVVCGGDQSFTTTITKLSITAQPALTPGFDPAASDYVTRCASNPVAMTVKAPDGTVVSIAGQPGRSGSFAQSVSLAPGKAFAFSTTSGGQTQTFHVRCLPSDFPAFTYNRPGTPSEAFYITTPQGAQTPDGHSASRYVAIFDDHGVPVWWAAAAGSDAKLLASGQIGWWTATSNGSSTPGFEVHNLDGSLLHTWRTVGSNTDIHDFQPLPNGDALLLTYPPRPGTIDLSPYGGPSQNATILEPEIQEIAPDGSKAWSWNADTDGHITPAETGQRWWSPYILGFPKSLPDGRQAYDYAHINSVQQVGDTIVVSMRQLDAVYAIDKSSGQIIWKLGGTARPESLSVVDDPEGSYPLGGQHFARVLPDGTLTIHDNNSFFDPARAPRAVRYRINLFDKTATLIDSVSDPDAPSSPCCGSASHLDDGSWLLSWGGTPVVTEFGADGSRHFELTFAQATGTTAFSYRVDGVPAGSLSIEDLRAGMDAMPSALASAATRARPAPIRSARQLP